MIVNQPSSGSWISSTISHLLNYPLLEFITPYHVNSISTSLRLFVKAINVLFYHSVFPSFFIHSKFSRLVHDNLCWPKLYFPSAYVHLKKVAKTCKESALIPRHCAFMDSNIWKKEWRNRRLKTLWPYVLSNINLHNSIQQSWNPGSVQVQILLKTCWRFVMVRISDNDQD